MRSVFCTLVLVETCAKSAIDDLIGRTSNVTVFTVVTFDVALEDASALRVTWVTAPQGLCKF